MRSDIDNLLDTAVRWAEAGHRTCLATLVYANGSAPRPPGSEMVIRDDGRFEGYLTGGCAEFAIAEIAKEAIAADRHRVVRFGLDSPYVDIQLPCGSGIDVFFHVDPDLSVLHSALARVRARESVALEALVGARTALKMCVHDAPGDLSANAFRRWYLPTRRLIAVGSGPIIVELAKLATTQHFEVLVFSPDADTRHALAGDNIPTRELPNAKVIVASDLDRFSAACILFHEHEREPDILATFLNSESFYLGALGSRKTQAERLQRLRLRGFTEADLARIHGPAGLPIGAQTPAEIGLSILAEITACYRSGSPPAIEWKGRALDGDFT